MDKPIPPTLSTRLLHRNLDVLQVLLFVILSRSDRREARAAQVFYLYTADELGTFMDGFHPPGDGIAVEEIKTLIRVRGCILHNTAIFQNVPSWHEVGSRFCLARGNFRDLFQEFLREVLVAIERQLTAIQNKPATKDGGMVESIEMLPVDIDDGAVYLDDYSTPDFSRRRGTAELATGSLARDILERFRRLSANYGTEVEIRGERAVIYLNERD